MSGMFRALGSWLSFKMKKKQMKLQTGNVLLLLEKCTKVIWKSGFNYCLLGSEHHFLYQTVKIKMVIDIANVKLLYFIRFTQSLMYIKQRHDNVVETMAQVKKVIAWFGYFFNLSVSCLVRIVPLFVGVC